jgi:hypothetical protein
MPSLAFASWRNPLATDVSAVIATISVLSPKPDQIVLVRVSPGTGGLNWKPSMIAAFGKFLSVEMEGAGLDNPLVVIPYVDIDLVTPAKAEEAKALAES